MKFIFTSLIALASFLSACYVSETDSTTNNNTTTTEIIIDTSKKAEIVSVTTTKRGNNYRFSVGIASPDIDCTQYANWWEIITEDGTLLYRRILGHSHANEQPFVRSGGNLELENNQMVIVRAHMNTSGYGTKAFKGSLNNGFTPITLKEDFALDLAKKAPLPTNCAF